MFDHIPLILAQAGTQDPTASRPPVGGEPTEATSRTTPPPAGGEYAANDGQGGGGSGGGQIIWMLLIGIMIVWFFSMFSGQRREKKKRAALLASLNKGSKVQTVGGILGTVVEVRDHDVLIKVDENSNTRIRFTRNSIQSVIEDKEE